MQHKHPLILSIFFTVICLVCLIKPVYSQESKAEDYSKHGLDYYNEGKYELAKTDFSKAIELNPNLAEAYYYLGNIANKNKNYDEAIENYNKAISLDNNFTNAYFNRANSYQAKNNLSLALADYTKAINLNPKLTLAYINRGDIYSSKGEYNNAFADYEQAIKLDPNKALTYFARGTTYQDLGKVDNAIEDFSQSIKLDPKYLPPYVNRGLAYVKKKEYDKAIADFNEAIKLKPDYANSYYNRGLVYSKKNDYEAAISDYNQAIKLNPNFANVYISRGNVYRDQNDFSTAIADYSQAIKLNPSSANAYYDRGEVYLTIGNYEDAINDFTDVIKLNPNDSETYYNRGEAYYKAGKYDKAILDFNKVIALTPDIYAGYFYRSHAYAKKGGEENLKLSLADYEKAKSLNPKGVQQLENDEKPWQEYKTEEGNFAVFMPSLVIKRPPINISGISVNAYTTTHTGVSYTVGYNIFPPNLFQNSSLKDIYDIVIKGLVGQANGKLISTSDIKIQDYPGKEVKIKNNNLFFQTQVFLIKQRAYYLVAVSKGDVSNLKQTKAFFSSFKLLSTPIDETLPEQELTLTKLHSQAGNFSVDMVGKAQPFTVPIEIANSKFNIYTFISITTNETYSAGYYDLLSTNTKNNPNLFFDTVREITIMKEQAKLVEESNISLQKHLGRYFILKKGNDTTIYTKLYLVNQRVYIISLTINGSSSKSEFADKYLNSFQLLGADFDDPFEDSETTKTDSTNNSKIENQQVEKLEDLLTVKETVLRGNAIELPSPEYPTEAKRIRIEDDVIVRVIVDKDGSVARTKVISGAGIFHEEVAKAAKAWRFKPSLLNGKPVRVVGDLTFKFKLP